MNDIVKCNVDPYGNALVACRTFAAGEVVFSEQPMLATLESSDILDDIYATHKDLGIRADLMGKDASIDFTLQMLQYCSADSNIKSAVQQLFTPDISLCRNEPYVNAAFQYAEQLTSAKDEQLEVLSHTVLAPIVVACDTQEIVRVVLAWVCNCYSTRDGGGALYKIASLVNHCCEGNTR